MKRLKICIISFSDLRNDPRVRRQIDTLKDKYDLTTIGLIRSETPGIKELVLYDERSFIEKVKSRYTFIFSRLFKHLYPKYIKMKYPIKYFMEMLSCRKFDLVIANGLDALIIAERIATRYGTRILFDAHEYEPKRIEDHWFYRLFVNPYNDFVCSRYLVEVSSMTTVSPGIADLFHRFYGVNPEVVLNVPEYKEIKLKDINSENIQMMHHGVAHPSRKLEDMIHLMAFLEERFHLTLMLVKRDIGYFNYLERLRDKVCPDRVDFSEPVPYDNIIPTIAEYDIGLIIYRPTSFNVRHSLPNKFFEYIMAGMAVVIGSSPEMKSIVEKYNCGFVTGSFEVQEIATLLNSLTAGEVMKKKKASLEAAKLFNSNQEMKKLLRIVEMTLSEKSEL